jgi:hypothetical protein
MFTGIQAWWYTPVIPVFRSLRQEYFDSRQAWAIQQDPKDRERERERERESITGWQVLQ